jgi:hypothetical protein
MAPIVGRRIDKGSIPSADSVQLVDDPHYDGDIYLDERFDVGYLSSSDRCLQPQHLNFCRYMRPALEKFDPSIDHQRILSHLDYTAMGTPVFRLTETVRNDTSTAQELEIQTTQSDTHFRTLEDGNHITSLAPEPVAVPAALKQYGRKQDFHFKAHTSSTTIRADGPSTKPTSATASEALLTPLLPLEDLHNFFGPNDNLLRAGSLNVNGNCLQKDLLSAVSQYIQLYRLDL